jgi:alcohol dehydrogenase class IV
MPNHLDLPTKINIGSVSDFVDGCLCGYSGRNILLLISKNSIERYGFKDFIAALSAQNHVIAITDFAAYPTQADIFKYLPEIESGFAPGEIIAVGGGSAIDTAKAISALYYLKSENRLGIETVSQSILSREYSTKDRGIKIVAVPTTAGTGSELTRWATVWDADKSAKYSVEADFICPEQAWIIPELTYTMPLRLTLSTGLDALCHATEAYWAKSGNAGVRELSKTAIGLLAEYLPRLLNDLQEKYLREKVMLGSLFAAMAFSNTRTTACHSISYPLTLKYGIEHGIAAAITLAQIAEFNKSAIIDIDLFLQAFKCNDIGDIQAALDNMAKSSLPLRLSAYGISSGELPAIAEAACTKGRIDNNPVAINKAQILKILKSVY